ncbi:MAG: EutN/CcmL family microcompartment protein [bacterium]|nr:EutN/CcmL family microcompartment protein [bacterium]
MLICKVIGNVVATKKEPKFEGWKILVVQPVDIDGKPYGTSFETIDNVQAGVGDLVLVTVQGSSARDALGDMRMPIDSVIVAVIDQIQLD